MSKKFTLNLVPQQEAWKVCRDTLPCDDFTIVAHEEWFRLAPVRDKILGRIFEKFNTEYDKLPIESAIEKAALKVHKLGIKMPADLPNFKKRLVLSTVGGLMVDSWIQSELVQVEMSSTGTGAQKRNHTTLIFEGKPSAKSLLEGYCVEPGELVQTHVGYQRLKTDMKLPLIIMDQQRWQVSDVYRDDWFTHIYQGSPEYNSDARDEDGRGETPMERRYRYDRINMDAVQQLRQLPSFSMPMKMDNRGRQNYWATKLYGFRPGGKLFETLFIDPVKAYEITERGAEHIQHMIYTLRYGKYSLDHAVKHFSGEDLDWARSQTPLDVKQPGVPYVKGDNDHLFKSFVSKCGKAILLFKLARALDMYVAGEPCSYVFGKDLTNSGLIMAGSCFGSQKMLTGANLMGHKRVKDSHMQFGSAHGIDHLDRDVIKEIHTPLLHGSSNRSIAMMLQEHVENPDDYSEGSVRQHNRDAYGPEVENIDYIADWGRLAVTNYQNILKWELPDGFVATHEATMERVPFTIYVASARSEHNPYRKFNLMGTMPVLFDAKHRPVYGRDNVSDKSDKGVKVKTRGLFANITHSIDAMLLRRIIKRLGMDGKSFMLKHDDYMVHPNDMDTVVEVCQEFFLYLRDHNLYQDAVDQIARKLQKPLRSPDLIVGKAPKKVKQSFNFLMV